MQMLRTVLLTLCALSSGARSTVAIATEQTGFRGDFDVLVYGATSGGVMAAVSSARNGAARVALLDPDKYPNATYAERAKIFEQHKFYTQVGGQRMNAACSAGGPPPPPVAHNASYIVSGAGSADCNGVYKYDSTQRRDPGTAFYTKDEAHQIDRINGVWHLAHSSVTVFYQARAEGGTGPPLKGWVPSSGARPVPTLKGVSGH